MENPKHVIYISANFGELIESDGHWSVALPSTWKHRSWLKQQVNTLQHY